MNAQEMLEQLEGLAEKIAIQVRYGKCRSRGGLCTLKGERMIIVRKGLTVPEKVEVLARSLCRFPLEDTYLMPEIRKLLERAAARLDPREPDESEAEYDEVE